MRIRPTSHVLHLAAGVFAVAATGAAPLGAQGGRSHGAPRDRAPVSSAAGSHLEPALGILRALVGTWRFEIWFAGNFNGAPDASGTRVARALFDDLRVEWSEELDHSQLRSQGIVGFDPRTDRFFSAAVSSAGAAPEFLTGLLSDAEPLITFSPLPGSSGGVSLSVLDRDHFALAALDRGWRALFTRQP